VRLDGPALVEMNHRADRAGRFEWVSLYSHSGQLGKVTGAPVPIRKVTVIIIPAWTVKCQPRDQDKVFWRADDGTILCDSLGRRDHNDVWLISEKEFGDLELKLKFQAYTNSYGNSGVQFRSRYGINAENGGWLDGPQVDIHPPAALSWRTELIYDETHGDRRWVSPSLSNSKIGAEFKPAHHVFKYAGDGDGWNDLTIIVQGTRVKTIVNGVVRTDWDGAGILDNAAHRQHQGTGSISCCFRNLPAVGLVNQMLPSPTEEHHFSFLILASVLLPARGGDSAL